MAFKREPSQGDRPVRNTGNPDPMLEDSHYRGKHTQRLTYIKVWAALETDTSERKGLG